MSVHRGVRARVATPWRRPGGFTLIELLTVVAIIALLAALLLPTLTRAKQAGYNTVCINNLRQWGVATRMYLDDCQAYPSTAIEASLPLAPGVMGWRERLVPYAKAGPWLGGWQLGQPGLPTGIDVCPGYLRLPGVFAGACGPYVAYAYNSKGQTPGGVPGVGLMWLVGSDPQSHRSVREAEVVCPSDMVLMGDSYPQSWHVASLGLPLLADPSSEETFRRWNRDNLSHR